MLLLEHELEMLEAAAVPGVPRVFDLVRDDGRPTLVLEDVGGVPLASVAAGGPVELDLFLSIAIHLSALLSDLHRRELTHRGLCPQSVLVDPASRQVWLTDFSRSSRKTGDTLGPIPLRLQPMALPYLSPEQTGRMNRGVDYRTDFYSLGVIFYELLTGAVPCRSDDALEVVHAHIARVPDPPSAVNGRVPEGLSSIVMKLLAKTAEERYQSAAGLRDDLEAVARAWTATGQMPSLIPGQRDVSDRFLVSQRLYGRDRDVSVLLSEFDRCADGPARMTLVAGYSGIGKTSLIRELYAPIVRERGYFIAGKFDQVARNTPYGALIQAFRELVQQLLTEPDDQIAAWQARLGDAMGANGGVMAEVIPEIELILGTQAPPVPLGPAETRNRFRLVFQDFLAALARPSHPLVVFLDDLQWADGATLDLLPPLLTGAEIRSLLLIGAYRDNEVDADHPLARTLAALEAAGARLATIALGPLALRDLTYLVRDTLHGDPAAVEPLAELIQRKTDGNPFFVTQFLRALHEDGLLVFDDTGRRWTYQLERIRAAAITDNVVDLMTRKIKRLPQEAERALTLAACIGNRFDVTTLATVSQQPSDVVAATLRGLIEEGLVNVSDRVSDFSAAGPSTAGSSGGAYEFLHDRVQQAAYALIPEDQRTLVHLTVGRLLRAACGEAVPEDRLFEIVSHLNVGSAAITDVAERHGVARLNLAAGRKAKTSTAYAAAAEYLDRGIALLPADPWTVDYDLAYVLHLEAAESHYLGRRFDIAERYFEVLLDRAATPLHKAQVHALRIVLYENLSHYRQAVVAGREGLALLGMSLADDDVAAEAALDTEIDRIQELLADRSIASLVDLPAATDADVRMAMRILTSLWSNAYITGHQAIARLISARLVRLSLAHGNTEDSAYGYVTHAITIGPVRGDYGSAYEWGELALSVNERFDDRTRRAKIHQQFHAHVKLWRRPFATCLEHAREARQSGLEAGDLNYAGYGAVTETWPAIVIANDLDRFVRDYEPAAALLLKLGLSDFLAALRVMLNWAKALLGRTAGPLSLTDATFDEKAFLEKFEEEPFFRTFFYTAKLHLAVLLEEIDEGRAAARRARQGTLAGTIWPVLVDFWGGLALTSAFDTLPGEERDDAWSQLVASEQTLGTLADNCPENYRAFHLLLSAEMKRISGDDKAARHLSAEAIAYAQQTRNLQQQALAHELAARAWLGGGDSMAAPLLVEAYRCYTAWGASVKVRQLEERYGHLLHARAPADWVPGAATAGPPAASLDLDTILKAAHAIAGEIEQDELVRTLMTIAVENAGAQRGYFLREGDGGLLVEAEATTNGTCLLRPPVERVRLPSGIVQYVRKTRQSVVLGDARTDGRFGQDPYVLSAHPRSVICMPSAHQGKLEGIMYLENNLAADAFTPEHIHVLDVICTQAAISLENARLYEEMKLEAAQRRRAEQMLRVVTEGTAAATGRDFFYELVRCLASALGVQYAFVAQCLDQRKVRAETLAFWKAESFGQNFEYDVTETPCRKVLEGSVAHYADRVQEVFPADRDLGDLCAASYLGAPIFDVSGGVIGHLAVLDTQPMPEDPLHLSVLRIFAARAGAELERMRAERELRRALTEVETLKNRFEAEAVYLQEEIRTEHNFGDIVGRSPALLEALHKVERVAPTDATVLITGETGVGKEMFARAVHARSRRNDRPLVKVNCGAIAPGLVESELFGHVKGAFTGAIDRRVGRFELANGGTIFLDEVGELPVDAQVKLLRVLQEQEFEPVGSSRTVRVSVRVIAATNRDLEAAAREGTFRVDLLYRLNVFPIEVPALRQRPDDIRLLAGYFIAGLSRRLGKPIDGLNARSLERLLAYTWPGNVRELQNVIERAAILAQGPILDLEPVLHGHPAAPDRVAPAAADGATLDEQQRRHIMSVLLSTGGVVEGAKGAATILGMHPNTLRSRMKKLGIPPRPRGTA